MRRAEDDAIARGTTVEALMARAGAGIAEQVARLASGSPILILCGPGNNGGDGYVAARLLRYAGADVRVAASVAPASAAARAARAGWNGPVEDIAEAASGPILVDALFGTGLSRPLDHVLSDRLVRLAGESRLSIAVDLPSGVSTDDGAVLNPVPYFSVTLALGAAKAAHLLQPSARYCGAVRVLDIGVQTQSDVCALVRPILPSPGPDAHKYSRGMVAVVAGAMPGAALLASVAAMRSNAGYVWLLGSVDAAGPHALVHRPFDDEALADDRMGALLIGPGLGRDAVAGAKLDRALESGHPLVIDGDALHLLDDRRMSILRKQAATAILTPHAGEFDALFGKGAGSKIDRARAAAEKAASVVVFKGADTVIAAPDGTVRVAADANDWLSTAGTGDVLAGAIAAMRAGGQGALAAASAGVWLHAGAARRCGAAFIADDLAAALTPARAAL